LRKKLFLPVARPSAGLRVHNDLLRHGLLRATLRRCHLFDCKGLKGRPSPDSRVGKDGSAPPRFEPAPRASYPA
jgi:hypothetical protein